MNNNNLTLEKTKQRINSFKDKQSIPIKKVAPYLNAMIRKISEPTTTGRVEMIFCEQGKNELIWKAKIKVPNKETLSITNLDEIELDPAHNR